MTATLPSTNPIDTQKQILKKVLILGSGGLRIGQAGEFDYSGSQAIKAVKEEGIKTVLINPNIATVQTDPDMADEVYLQPLNLATATKIIERERPDAILLNVGGQTALNIGLELEAAGVLEKFNVAVLGTPVSVIRTTEDRELFKTTLAEVDIHTARSITVDTVEAALAAAEEIEYPVMIRSGYSLGGLGSGLAKDARQLQRLASEALNACPHILVEEYLKGWKEVEYEIVRDADDNCITVCNMENMDPMGIHTGESIVVAPSQTLTNHEYHFLREIAIRAARHLGIVGECNIQYALDPKTGDYRVIEVNARLSRSSALASKATGYPLAFVSTKLCLGKRLWEITNAVTRKTSAFFEPALDYLVVKLPRWDTHKMKTADRRIGSEMKSVGEVMAIGRSFPEALQKAIRMRDATCDGISDIKQPIVHPISEIEQATDRRLTAIYQYLHQGGDPEEIEQLSHIDPWFIRHIADMAKMDQALADAEQLDSELIRLAKQMGFSDSAIGKRAVKDADEIRAMRLEMGIFPVVKQIDTLAGEFQAETNYLYLTYHGSHHDLEPSPQAPVTVIGSGPYCIGSSVEFDWCAVNTARTLRRLKEATIIVNSNPETVSTDYDESDRLYFEELSLERLQDIADFERPKGIVVSVGGQIANNLALPLNERGYPIMGTSAQDIDRAENRQKFSSLLNDLDIDQPTWEEVRDFEQARAFAERVGYPVLVRPSYVLSGAAMNVVFDEKQLHQFLEEAAVTSPEHPTVISQFINNAKELEIDGVADKGTIVIYAISEHVENAGVHSGDATVVLPPQRLYLETIRRTKKISRQIVQALNISGPFNMQFIAVDNAIKVIECNVRASRSFPFVSKVANNNFIEIATEVLLGTHERRPYETLELDYVGVKTPLFSFSRLKGANPVPHVEMASTGEVACIGDSYLEAFYASWLATEQQVAGKRILLSITEDSKRRLLPAIRRLEEEDWEIYATEGTHDFLSRHGIGTAFCYKDSAELEPSAGTLIANKAVDLVINLPRSGGHKKDSDGYYLRRLTIDNHIPLITNLQIAQLFLMCLTELDRDNLAARPWKEYMRRDRESDPMAEQLRRWKQ